MILTYHANSIVKYSKNLNIQSAFTRRLKVFWNCKSRRACIQRVNSLGSYLPQSLVTRIKDTVIYLICFLNLPTGTGLTQDYYRLLLV